MMNKYRILIKAFVCIVLTVLLSVTSTAYELVTEKLSDEEKNRFVKEYDFKISNTPLMDLEFSTFDVNSNGEYLMGFLDYEGRGFDTRSVGKISIYSAENEFLNGIIFNTPGAFNVYWNGENINIYSYRDDVLFTVDTNGSFIDIKDVPHTDENSDFINKELNFKTKTVNGITYSAKTGNSLIDDNEEYFSGQYFRLVKTDEQGRENVIYEKYSNEESQPIYIIIIIILVFLLSLGVVVFCFKRFSKSNKSII